MLLSTVSERSEFLEATEMQSSRIPDGDQSRVSRYGNAVSSRFSGNLESAHGDHSKDRDQLVISEEIPTGSQFLYVAPTTQRAGTYTFNAEENNQSQ